MSNENEYITVMIVETSSEFHPINNNLQIKKSTVGYPEINTILLKEIVAEMIGASNTNCFRIVIQSDVSVTY